jgi:hypothetical protein
MTIPALTARVSPAAFSETLLLVSSSLASKEPKEVSTSARNATAFSLGGSLGICILNDLPELLKLDKVCNEWVLNTDAPTGTVYYVNPRTKERCWKTPWHERAQQRLQRVMGAAGCDGYTALTGNTVAVVTFFRRRLEATARHTAGTAGTAGVAGVAGRVAGAGDCAESGTAVLRRALRLGVTALGDLALSLPVGTFNSSDRAIRWQRDSKGGHTAVGVPEAVTDQVNA